MLPLYGSPELNSKEVRQNLANCEGWLAWELQELQLKPSLDSLYYTCRWKRRPRWKITDYIAMINGNPNLRFWTCIHDSGHEKRTILQMGSDKMIPRHVYDKPFIIRFPDRSEWNFSPTEGGGG
jgi:hypothetical protein